MDIPPWPIDVWALAQPYVFSFSLLTAIEMLFPRDRQSLASRLPGLIFWAAWAPVLVVAQRVFGAMFAALGIAPLIVVPVSLEWQAALVAPVIAAVIYDFFFYWFHRAQHRWFWRFHEVHHSVRDLNVVNAYHHVTEPFFQSLLLVLPASLVAVRAEVAAPMMIVILHVHASFIHSPTRLHLGPLRAVLVDNRYHRIHHSVEERHFGRNFGAFTTLWDRVFGTAHFPAADEWPDTGVTGVEPPRTIVDWIAFPFRGRARQPMAIEPAANI